MIEAVITEGINTQLQSLATTSNNVANANTPGYLRQTSFTQVLDAQIQTQTQVSSKQLSGAIKQTGKLYDFAVLGKSLFVVELQGELRLTQDGRFHLNEAGDLVHISGAMAMTSEGPLAANTEADQIAARLWTVSTSESYTNLQPAEMGLYLANLDDWKTNDDSKVLAQALNYTEHNATADVLEMMRIQRSVESLQKAYQTYDAAIGYGISELGRR
jgi:flagellar basal-body rod protein FlgF